MKRTGDVTGPRMSNVFIMGLAMQHERALLARLRDVAGLTEGHLVACNDLRACDLLVVRDDSAMRHVGQKMLAGRPGVLLWILDADGELIDGLSAAPAPMDPATIADALRALCGMDQAAADAPAVDEVEAETVAATEAGSPAAPTAGTGTDTPQELPGDLTIGRAIRERVHEGVGCIALVHHRKPVLLLDFDRRIAASVGAHASEVNAQELAVLLPELELQTVDIAAFGGRSHDPRVMPLVPLLWNIALHAGGGSALMPPLAANTVMSLRQWPDFRALAHRHDHFRLCSLLLKRPSTAHEASAMLELPAEVVHGFFNAAYLSGYAVITEGVPMSPAVPAQPAKKESAGARLVKMWRNVRARMRA